MNESTVSPLTDQVVRMQKLLATLEWCCVNTIGSEVRQRLADAIDVVIVMLAELEDTEESLDRLIQHDIDKAIERGE